MLTLNLVSFRSGRIFILLEALVKIQAVSHLTQIQRHVSGPKCPLTLLKPWPWGLTSASPGHLHCFSVSFTSLSSFLYFYKCGHVINVSLLCRFQDFPWWCHPFLWLQFWCRCIQLSNTHPAFEATRAPSQCLCVFPMFSMSLNMLRTTLSIFTCKTSSHFLSLVNCSILSIATWDLCIKFHRDSSLTPTSESVISFL